MRVVLIGGSAFTLINFRGELLRSLARAGHEVLALAPDEDPTVTDRLLALGVSFDRVPIARTGLNPITDLFSLAVIARRFRRSRPDVVLSYTAKAVIYGSLAARLAGVGTIAAMITGVGSALGARGGFRGVVAGAMRLLYRAALGGCAVIFFQNPDDEAFFRRSGMVTSRQRTVLINGSGVDLQHFAAAPLPSSPPFVFLMVGRLLRDKGVAEYATAAAEVRKRSSAARFRLLGGLDSNPTSITASQLEEWQRSGAIEYLGACADVRPHIAAAHVIVLPSYGEGLPRSVLEGMALGRAVITTDVPGCRETVSEGINGFLVPPRDPDALSHAMTRLLENVELPAKMGEASRVSAEARFDVHAVNRVILAALGVA